MLRLCFIIFISLPVYALAAAEDNSEISESKVAKESESKTDSDANSQAAATTKEYVTPNTAKTRNADVIRYLKNFQREDEIIEIDGKNGKMNGLYLPENTGKPQGGVLILHDIAQHAHWPNTVTPIREYLPEYGWNTLSIFFDEYIKKPLPNVKPIAFSDSEKTDNTGDPLTSPENPKNESPPNEDDLQSEPTQEALAETSADPQVDENQLTLGNQDEAEPLNEIANNVDNIDEFELPITPEVLEQPAISIEETFLEDMIQKAEDGLGTLNQLGQFNVAVIANGYSANWAAKMLEKRLTDNKIGYALILVDAKSSEYPEVALNESLAELGIPMLDIITDDSPEHLRISKKRKGAIMRNQNKKYMQVYLPAITTSLGEKDNMISRRIRGWLKTHAAGEEVPVKVNQF